MRIISGKFKAKRITAPPGLPVRPTTDMAKESLFNILGNLFYFEEIRSLDLFSGTGNITYELASRGVRDITSVDINGMCTRFIRETLEKLQLKDVKVVQQDAVDFISKTFQKYDLIFADPPFEYLYHEEIIDKVFTRDILKDDGVLVIEHSGRKDFSKNVYFYDHRKYGSVHFSFFKKTEVEERDEKETLNFYGTDM